MDSNLNGTLGTVSGVFEQAMPDRTTKELDAAVDATLKSMGGIIEQKVRESLMAYAREIDAKRKAMCKAREDLHLLLSRLNLLTKGTGTEVHSINFGGTLITAEMKIWEKSDFFKTLIMANLNEKEKKTLTFIDRDPTVVRHILEYLRTDDEEVLVSRYGIIKPSGRTKNLHYYPGGYSNFNGRRNSTHSKKLLPKWLVINYLNYLCIKHDFVFEGMPSGY